MKFTGIVTLGGRVVIPAEIRKNLEIYTDMPLEIYLDGESIVLRKYEPQNTCIITGQISDCNMVMACKNICLSKEGAAILLRELQMYS